MEATRMIWDGSTEEERWLKMARDHRKKIKTVVPTTSGSWPKYLKALVVANVLGLLFLVGIGLFSCASLTPATEVIYEGDIEGNYKSSEDVMSTVLATRDCMGFAERDFPLPQIKGMSGGNSVQCGASLKKACYSPGVIIVPQNATLEVIGHEAVHHYLMLSTGDMDMEHKSPYFLTCGGSVKSE